MTPRKLVRQPLSWPLVSRLERPEAALLAVVLAAIAGVGWYASPFWLAVAVAGQLALGGLGAVWIIGPATARLGFARYASLAFSGIAVTLFGRVVVDPAGLFLLPVAAVVLWGVIRLELELNQTGRGALLLELAMVALVFAVAEGVAVLVPREAWPAALGLLLATAAVPSLRMSEARGRYGAQAVGESLLHLLAMAQVAGAVRLLDIPALVGAALVALTFHAWSGAAEALDGRASVRSVALEFGALAILGLVVALLLQGV